MPAAAHSRGTSLCRVPHPRRCSSPMRALSVTLAVRPQAAGLRCFHPLPDTSTLLPALHLTTYPTPLPVPCCRTPAGCRPALLPPASRHLHCAQRGVRRHHAAAAGRLPPHRFPGPGHQLSHPLRHGRQPGQDPVGCCGGAVVRQAGALHGVGEPGGAGERKCVLSARVGEQFAMIMIRVGNHA